MNGKAKKYLFFLLKLALAAGILALLYFWRDPPDFARLRAVPPLFLAAAAACMILQIALTAARWHSLLRASGAEMSFFRAFSLTMQSMFFSLCMPGGAVGGDVVKAGIVTKTMRPGSKFNAVFSILIDRLTGVAGLFFATLILSAFHLRGLTEKSAEYQTAFYFLNALCLAGLGGVAAVFFHDYLYRIPPVGRVLTWLDARTRGAFTNAVRAAETYRRHWKRVIFWMLFSGFVMFPLLAGVIGFAAAGIQKVAPADCVYATDLGSVASAIPVTPGGMGTRDYAALLVLRSDGGMTDASAKLATGIYTLILLLLSLSGGLFFIVSENTSAPEKENAS